MNQIDWVYQFLTNSPFSHFTIFLIFVVLSLLIGKYTTNLIKLILFLFPRQQRKKIDKNLISPIKNQINFAGTWVLLYFCWRWLEKHERTIAGGFYFLIDLAFTIFAIVILSRLLHQLIRLYGIVLFQKIGGATTEILLATETFLDLMIGLIALTIFASQHGFPLTGLLAGLSLSGIVLGFAAQNTLQQIFGTVILLLDKPFIQGEYIRLPDDTLGRVESIGLRSTKIRTAAKNTLLIVPNSKMADWQIENVTRGKKVMILSYLDFERLLDEYEQSLVRQIITKYFKSFFGTESNTSNIVFLQHPDRKVSRARVTFFIFGSTESSVEMRKRLIEMSETRLSKELRTHGINYTENEPFISVDSPISL